MGWFGGLGDLLVRLALGLGPVFERLLRTLQRHPSDRGHKQFQLPFGAQTLDLKEAREWV